MDRAIAYIDGFGFYNGFTKHTKYKWCDLFQLCERLVPECQIVRVKIFAGRPKNFANNPNANERQRAYFQALRIHSKNIVQTFEYRFAKGTGSLPLTENLKNSEVKMVDVTRYQEKQADVDLAIHIVNDAAKNRYDKAIIFTNDVDFLGPIKMVRDEYSKKVIWVPTAIPPKREPKGRIRKVSSETILINNDLLELCQLPPEIERDGKESLVRPLEWS